MRYSYAEKQAIVTSGLLAEYEKGKRQAFKGNFEQLDQFVEDNGKYISDICHSVSNTKYRQRKNIENRFEHPLYFGMAIFLTLTFTDEVLQKTSQDTRRQYVRKFLKENCDIYVANIDFGDKNGREHYHALVRAKNGSIDLKQWQEKCGLINAERVKKTDKDRTKVSRYLAKLSQHALKKSGRLPRLIWSRGWKKALICDDDLLPF